MPDPALALSVDCTAVPARSAGAGQYTVQLTRALSLRPDVDVVLFTRRGDRDRWRSLVPGGGLVPVAPESRPLRLAWEQLRLPGLIAGAGVAVHHSPHYTMPERSKVPTVVTVHDLSFFVDPGWHERSKVIVFRRAITVAARRAAVVVCPSRTTADELARWCRVEAEVVVAHHGVDRDRFRPDEPSGGADDALLSSLDPRLVDGRPWLVFVGTLEPRKDVPLLIGAFTRIADRHPDALLVLAGGPGWGSVHVERAIARSGAAPRIVRTGYVDDPVVPALLRRATGAVYPARYEGFGLPALEALACGARLVTTSGTAMEEVTGDTAVLVPPGDEDGLAEALDVELGRSTPSPEEAARRRRGFDIAAAHTWEASAELHMGAYRRASGLTR